MVPDEESAAAELRFWYNNKLVEVKKAKNDEINIVQF